MTNPLLIQEGLPKFKSIESKDIEPGIASVLETLDSDLKSLEDAIDGTSSYEATIEALEKISAPLGFAWGVVGHLEGVKNSDALRDAKAAMQPKVVGATQKLGQSRKVYEALEGIAARDEVQGERKRIVDASLRSMRLGGVALEGDAKEQYNANQVRLSELSTAFSNNVLDATKAFELVLTDAADVAGLPPSARAAAAEKALSLKKCEKADAENGPWALGLDAPSYIPAMQHLKSSALREKLYAAFVTRAGEQNAPLIDEILSLKQKQAKLLGFESYADVSLASKMAASVAEIEELHELLAAKATPAAHRELAELKEYASSKGHEGSLEHWDVPYWAERLREERFDYSDEELRPYFALPAVLDGLFQLIERLFGVTVEAADGKAEVWNDDVRYFEVKDGEKVVASFYLDPYSRPADKRGGAWMDVCVGKSKALKRDVPTAYLTCNGSPPVGDKPSLMTFDEVNTLYHEMGHGLQHMLTKVEDGDAAGINGVEWDAVELPSQFMENWLLDRPTLYGFAKHYETGEPLPDEFYDKLKGSKTFHAGLAMTRQLAFGMLDVELHKNPKLEEPVFDVQKRIFGKYLALAPRDYDRFLCAFSHIFAGGYSCGYYSYKWAEVLSADAFGAFEEAGLDDEAAVRELGQRFRDTVLACGGGTPPAEVFETFRGRKPSPEALIRHSGLAESWQAAGKGPKVSGAASASLKDGRVLLWGGLDEARNAVDSLYAFEDGAWTPVETTGFKPQKAMYAAAATQSLVGTSGKEEFVVCGGWDPGEKGSGGSFSDAVHALDVNKLEWQKDDPLPCGPVSRHAAATVGGSAEGRIYIHAFRDGVVRRDACGIAKSHKTTGRGPESLSMCAVAPVGDAGLLVVGGATKNGEFSDRAYVLDTKSYEWTELDALDGPTARGSACCAALDASRVVFFGGAGKGTDSPGSGGLKATAETWLLTVDGAKGTWEQLDVAGCVEINQ